MGLLSRAASASAETILTLKNRVSIHLGVFINRLHWKESIHTMIGFIFTIGDTWNFMHHDTWYTVFKNRLSTTAYVLCKRRKEEHLSAIPAPVILSSQNYLTCIICKFICIPLFKLMIANLRSRLGGDKVHLITSCGSGSIRGHPFMTSALRREGG